MLYNLMFNGLPKGQTTYDVNTVCLTVFPSVFFLKPGISGLGQRLDWRGFNFTHAMS